MDKRVWEMAESVYLLKILSAYEYNKVLISPTGKKLNNLLSQCFTSLSDQEFLAS